MTPVSEWEVVAGASEEAADFAAMLRQMYAAWDGPMEQEAGVHRLTRISPLDPQRRRHTSFALVRRIGDEMADWEPTVRSYILDPYQMAKDHQTGRETDRVLDVLAGRLDLLLQRDPGE